MEWGWDTSADNKGLRRSCRASAPARKALLEEMRSARTLGSDFCQTSQMKAGICLLGSRSSATSVEKVKPAFFLSAQAPEVKLILTFFFLIPELVFLFHYHITTACISQIPEQERFQG